MSDDDSLMVSEVGEWTLEKHARLKRYIDISRAVRRKFVRRAGATYIDLFCGPGKSTIRETGEAIRGSPVVAVATANEGQTPFTDVFLADSDEVAVRAAADRVRSLGASVHAEVGPAKETVKKVVAGLDQYALHFAFLDPFNLDPLPFSVIEELAHMKRMDMLIHVSIQDLQRNLRRYMEEDDGVLDHFAPGWRQRVDVRSTDRIVRTEIFRHWLNLIRGLDMEPSEGIERVSGSKNQPLYWLVFVSRHERAKDFWEKIRNVSSQHPLF
jgi:three-Cys-motif partner protein